MKAFVPDQRQQELQVGWAQVLTRSDEKREVSPPHWEYFAFDAVFDHDRGVLVVVNVDGDTEVSSVRSSLAIGDALRELGLQRWELVAVVPSVMAESGYMYVFKRPISASKHGHLELVEEGDTSV